LGVSLCIFLYLKGIRNKKVYFINSGLFEKKSNNIFITLCNNFIIKFAINISDKIIFTSSREYQYAFEKSNFQNDKFALIPFCIDTNYWKTNRLDFSQKDGILFVGNNEFRDIKKVIEIAKRLKEIKFTLLTSLIEKDIEIPKNIELIKGDLNKKIVDDSEVKKLYEKSRLTILPIKENIVTSSGQSVALQSLGMGTPVIINKTGGFWEDPLDADLYGYTLVNNDIEEWISKIKEIYNDEKKLNKISRKGIETVNNKFNFDIFNKEMEKLIIN